MSKETSWQRRKHTATKPNFIVRGIYWVSDWLADFKGIVGATKRGVGHAALVGVNLTILIAVFLLSAMHSVTLLRVSGLHNGEEYLALIIFEVAFITYSILVDVASKRNQKPIVIWIPFIICLIFVLASNIVAMKGWGKLIGGVLPFMLLFSKWALAWVVKNRKPADIRKEVEPAAQVIETTSENIAQKPDEKTEENLPVERIEPITLEDKNIEENTVEKLDVKLDSEPPKTEPVALDIQEEKRTELTVKLNPKLSQKLEQNLDFEQPKTEPITEEKTTPKSNTKPKITTERKRTSTKGSGRKKKPKKLKASEVDYDSIILIARELQKQHEEKKLPSKYMLAKKADTTEHHAQKALDIMDKLEAEKTASKIEEKNEPKLVLVK